MNCLEKEFNDKKIEPRKEEMDRFCEIINKYGGIKTINSDPILLKAIVLYSDVKLFGAYVMKLNDSLNNNELKEEDLVIIRTDWFINMILNLEQNLEPLKRSPEKRERRTKILLSSFIEDEEIQIKLFTNDKVVNAFAGIEKDEDILALKKYMTDVKCEVKAELLNSVLDTLNVKSLS